MLARSHTARLVGTAAGLLSVMLCAGGPGHGSANRIPGRYIVVLHEQSVSASDVAQRHGVSPDRVFGTALHGFAGNIPEPVVARLLDDPEVDYIEPDGVACAFGKPVRTPPVDISTLPPESVPWGVSRVGGPGIYAGGTAWVIDTGIDLDHPDLNVLLHTCKSFVGDVRSADDRNGHGTHVAGTIAAVSNSIDIVGVAPGAPLVSVRVLDSSGVGWVSTIVAGVDYVAKRAAAGDVANMSLGAAGHFQSLHDAVLAAADKGVLFAIAAGNNGTDCSTYEPAHVEHPNVYTVSAIDSQDSFAAFSNYGNPPVDLAAPGVGILSLAIGGDVATMTGTSAAAPHVAGLLLLGPLSSDGVAAGDPDGIPDPIAHR